MNRKKTTKHEQPYYLLPPLGVSIQEDQICFCVVIPYALECRLMLFYEGEEEPARILTMTEEDRIGTVFTTCMPRKEMQYQEYCYEANGKYFIDPYARAISGRDHYGEYFAKTGEQQLRGRFDFSTFSWKEDKSPQYSYADLILYKLHVRGFTKSESSKVMHKGTYLGIVDKIPYLKSLGINAVLLMPCVEYNEIMEDGFQKTPSPFLSSRSTFDSEIRQQNDISINSMPWKNEAKINYWGYTGSYYYFAPKASYAYSPKNACVEFKKMVRELHSAGIEVLMEMYFQNDIHPDMLLDCLRFWIVEYHIDGFRIMGDVGFEKYLATDPYLANTKLIASYWNTEDIYGRGIQPRFRNLAEERKDFAICIRRFLKGDEDQLSLFTKRFNENSSTKAIFHTITDHDGFTLWDLYSYDIKHNEDNLENNKDGNDYNYSWNCGAEGTTRKKRVNELRLKIIKNALCMLMLSTGVPMLLSGDEFGNSQEGNNNAYCQDNEISWLNWKGLRSKHSIFEHTKQLIMLRRSHKLFHLEQPLRGMDYLSCGYPDISYHGKRAWQPEYTNYARTLGILLCGNYAISANGKKDAFLYFIINMHWEGHQFDLPRLPKELEWSKILCTDGMCLMKQEEEELIQGDVVYLEPRSVAVFLSRKFHRVEQLLS